MLSDLPDDVLLHIMALLNINDRLALLRTCRRLAVLVGAAVREWQHKADCEFSVADISLVFPSLQVCSVL
jgi:hypothetical protein